MVNVETEDKSQKIQMIHYVTDADELCIMQLSLIGVIKSATEDKNCSLLDIKKCLELLEKLIPDPDEYDKIVKTLEGDFPDKR